MKKVLVFPLLLALFSAFVLISGCEESECEINNDCPSRECFRYECVDGECVEEVIRDCCGNRICEEGQNYCNCPQDCVDDPCEGKIPLDDSGREMTEYLERTCVDDECVADFDRDDQRTITLTFDRDRRYFVASFEIDLKRPFDLNSDTIDVRGVLEDIDDSTVSPIDITRIRIVEGDVIYGQLSLDEELSEIGDSFEASVPINYVPDKIESQSRLRVQIYYTFDYEDSRGDIDTRRGELDYRFSENLYMVRTGELR